MPQGIVEHNRAISWQLLEISEGNIPTEANTLRERARKEIKKALIKPLSS